MGEVDAAPETAARVVEDLTAMEVDPAKGERLHKAALIYSSSGTAYRMLSKTLKTGQMDLVHYGCALDEEGNPTSKWSIRRILEQASERFDKEIAGIQKTIKDNGEEVVGVWVHDMTAMPDVETQGNSLKEWGRKMAVEVRKKPS